MATRRQFLATTGSIVGGGAIVTQMSGEAAATTDVSFDVPEEIEYDSRDGRLRYFRANAEYDLGYEGFQSAAKRVRVRLYATVGGTERLVSETRDNDVSGVSGRVSGSLPQVDLLDEFGSESFGTGTTELSFRLWVQFQTERTSDGPVGEETETVEVIVNETDGEASLSVGGSVSFDGDGA